MLKLHHQSDQHEKLDERLEKFHVHFLINLSCLTYDIEAYEQEENLLWFT